MDKNYYMTMFTAFALVVMGLLVLTPNKVSMIKMASFSVATQTLTSRTPAVTSRKDFPVKHWAE